MALVVAVVVIPGGPALAAETIRVNHLRSMMGIFAQAGRDMPGGLEVGPGQDLERDIRLLRALRPVGQRE